MINSQKTRWRKTQAGGGVAGVRKQQFDRVTDTGDRRE